MTETCYESIESFLDSWEDPDEQARIAPAVARICDAVFLVSEEVQTYVRPE
jgi:hypothetical protein